MADIARPAGVAGEVNDHLFEFDLGEPVVFGDLQMGSQLFGASVGLILLEGVQSCGGRGRDGGGRAGSAAQVQSQVGYGPGQVGWTAARLWVAAQEASRARASAVGELGSAA
jgi:hypothetical protein